MGQQEQQSKDGPAFLKKNIYIYICNDIVLDIRAKVFNYYVT